MQLVIDEDGNTLPSRILFSNQPSAPAASLVTFPLKITDLQNASNHFELHEELVVDSDEGNFETTEW